LLGGSSGNLACHSPPVRTAGAAPSATTPAASTARSGGSGAMAGLLARSRMRSASRREPSRRSSTVRASTATCSRIAARPPEPSMKERGGGVVGASRPLLRSAIPLPPTASSPPTTPAGRKPQSAKWPPE
jgi:hypothetical protein